MPSEAASLTKDSSANLAAPNRLEHRTELSQSLFLEMKLNSERARQDETTWTKIAREFDVVGGGMAQGACDSARKAVRDPNTLLKFGGSALIGAGLTMAQGKAGLFRLSAQVVGLGLAGAFATDVYGKGGETWGVMKDTWNRPENSDINRQKIERVLGPFIVDFGIYSAGGATGITGGKYFGKKFFGPKTAFELDAKTGARQVKGDADAIGVSNTPVQKTGILSGNAGSAYGSQSRQLLEIPTLERGRSSVEQFPGESPIGKVYQQGRHSVAKVEVLVVDGKVLDGRHGSAASLGDGKLVTNLHVVDKAADVTVFDRQGVAHKADTVAIDLTADLAILSLRDRASFPAFEPIPVKTGGGNETGTVFALGHPEGSNALHVSKGEVVSSGGRPNAIDINFNAALRQGNSGGPLMNSEGQLIGIVRSYHRTTGVSNASQAWHVARVLKENPRIPVPEPVTSPQTSTTTYDVADVGAAKANVEKMFGGALQGEFAPNFLHSKMKRVPLEGPSGQPRELVLRTQIHPTTKQLIVEPLTLGGKPLTKEAYWPGTSIPIATARLSLKFDPLVAKAEMQAVNDPLGILREAFNFRSEGNYLAGLKPQPARPKLLAAVENSSGGN